MKLVATFVCAVLCAAILAPIPALAATAETANRQVTVRSGETITDDLYTASNDVVVAGTLDGNLIAAGDTITINGTVTRDVWAVGSTITINGTVSGSIRGAGNTIVVNGTVSGDLLGAGNTVTVSKGATVGRDVWVGSGELVVDGTVGRNIKARSSSVRINGAVGGAVSVTSSQALQLGPAAVINGSVRSVAPEQPQRDQAARVSGAVDYQPASQTQPNIFERIRGQLYWFLASVLLLVAILLYARRAARTAAALLRKQPGWSLLAGLAFALFVPLAAVILLVTVVGIPLALVSLFGYLLVLYTAKLFVALLAGQLLLQNDSDRFWPTLGAGLLGLFIVYILTALPLVGGVIGLLVAIFGTGAQVLLAKQLYRDNRSKYGV